MFDSEWCHEEEAAERARERERLREEAQAEAGGLGPAQRTSSDPAVNSLKVKKGKPHPLIMMANLHTEFKPLIYIP